MVAVIAFNHLLRYRLSPGKTLTLSHSRQDIRTRCSGSTKRRLPTGCDFIRLFLPEVTQTTVDCPLEMNTTRPPGLHSAITSPQSSTNNPKPLVTGNCGLSIED